MGFVANCDLSNAIEEVCNVWVCIMDILFFIIILIFLLRNKFKNLDLLFKCKILSEKLRINIFFYLKK